MNAKIKLMALVAGLLSILPMTSAWAAGSSTTYYAALKASVSNTGGGKVYAGTSNSAGTYTTHTSTSANQSSEKQNEGKTFYAFAQADDGFEFAGWSTTDGGTVASTANPYEVTVKCSSDKSDSPTTTTVWANFKKKVLAMFGITFETSDAGIYTVDGAAPENKTGLTEATSVELESADPNFLNWKVNGKDVVDNPYTATCTADTTISAVFLTADMVAEVTTFDELTAALANNKKKKITIPAGTDIAIAKGATVTVPVGTQLVVNGSLAVVGTLANSGMISGNGTIYKISYLIEQGEIKKPLQVTGEEWGNMAMAYHGYKPYYRVTTTTANTPKLTLGTISGCASPWAVLFKGKAVKISKQSPKALAVTRDTADSASTIKSIADNADTDEIQGNSDYVLLQDCTISGPLDSKSRVSSQKAYDCAGHKATISASKIAGSNMLFMNGVVALTPSSENQNSIATFINCSSITLEKIKNSSPAYYFYDCGSLNAAVTVSFKYYSSTRTTDYRKAYFYSGCYSYTFNTKDDSGKCTVYNGTYTSDPTAYLASASDSGTTDGLEAPKSGSYFTVKAKAPPPTLVKIGNDGYETLQDAINAAANGATLKLEGANVLTGEVSIPAGKKLTIDLNSLSISGGSIKNEGALRLEDNSSANGGMLSSPVVNVGSGTIDITYGNYAGTITVEGGVLTTHNGTFTSTFSAIEAGGKVLLKGGHFDGTVAILEGYCQRSGYIGQKVVGYIADASKIGDADVSYQVTGFNPNDVLGIGASDETLYLNFMQSKSGWSSRSDFVGREVLWDRLAELRSIGEPIKGQAFEASIAFDRAVDSGTVAGWAEIKGQTETMDIDRSVAADEDYHILIPIVEGHDYTAKSFKHMFDGEDYGAWEKVRCGVENKSLDNIGTTVTLKFQIRTRVRAADYRSDAPKYDDTFETVASRSYKFTGNGAIYGNKDYDSLAEAIAAVEKAGTILLSKDCVEEIEIDKEVSFTLDKNNFSFLGTIKVAAGYVLVNSGNFYLITKKSEEDKDKTDEEIAEKVNEELQKPDDDVSTLTKKEVQILENAGIDVKQEKIPTSVIKEATEIGTPMAATLAIEETKIPAGGNWSFGLASVKVEAGKEKIGERVQVEKGDTSVPLAVNNENKDKGMEFDASTLAPGVYKKTITVDAHTMIDPNSDELVVQETGLIKGEPIALPIPSESTLQGEGATLDKIIDPKTLVDGDEIKYYNQATKVYDVWTYNKGKSSWSSGKVYGASGEQEEHLISSADLRIGTAAWFTRNIDSAAPVKVIGVRSAAELKTEIKEDGWSLLANPNPTDEFNLSAIEVAEGTDDVEGKASAKDQIVEVTGVARKTFTYDVNKKSWGYYEKKVVNGKYQRDWTNAAKIGAGKPFWFVSGGGKPTIDWKKGAAKQEESK